ncbi:MAG TPA: hypothetical protein VMX17_13790 [Candidatus Glassbacteria bacterium]|nr:hypothetical protein [Candidatus Glassbacteria bacterium]
MNTTSEFKNTIHTMVNWEKNLDTKEKLIEEWESNTAMVFAPRYTSLIGGPGMGVYGLPHFRNSRAAQEIY